MSGQGSAGDRYRYWFPLVLMGFLLLGLLGYESVRSSQDFGWFAYTPMSDTQILSSEQYLQTYSESRRYMDYMAPSLDLWQYPPRDWLWAAIVVATFIASVGWYGWRAHRAGAPSMRPYVGLALGGGTALAGTYILAAWAAGAPNPSEVATSVGLPLAVLGVVAGAWAYFRPGPGRRVAAVTGVVGLLAGASTMLGSQAPLLVDPVIITAGLLGLAWLERSVLLALGAAAVLAGMAVFPVGVLSMLVPAAVLLATAIAALVPGDRPSGAGSVDG